MTPGEDGDLVPSNSTSATWSGASTPLRDSTPGRWPPLTSTHVGPSSWIRRAMSTMASTSSWPVGARSARRAASHRLGVVISASGSRWRR